MKQTTSWEGKSFQLLERTCLLWNSKSHGPKWYCKCVVTKYREVFSCLTLKHWPNVPPDTLPVLQCMLPVGEV